MKRTSKAEGLCLGKHFLTERNTKENYQLAVWEQVILQQVHFKGREMEFSYLIKEIRSLNTRKKELSRD